MKANRPTKKSGEIVLGLVILLFAFIFVKIGQFWLSFFSLVLLVILLKLDELKRLVINPRSGLEAEFQIPEENIKKDIEENDEPVNKGTFTRFKEVEEDILKEIHRKIGGELKSQIHYMYGMPDHPEFVYTPDATIQTENELIFLEIKYILKPEFAQKIVENAGKYLKNILDKFSPVAGKKLVAKLVLVSGYELDLQSFDVPQGIEIEFYKL